MAVAQMQAPPVVLIRLPETKRRVALSRSAIYSRVAEGTFPAPVSLGSERAVAWVAGEVDSWIAARIAERNGTR